MIIERERSHTFSMAQYESLRTSAKVVIDTEETGQTPTEALIMANHLLDDVLQEDVDRGDQTSKSAEDNTYVHAWKDTI